MITQVAGIIILTCIISFALLFFSALYGIQLPGLIDGLLKYVFVFTLVPSIIIGGVAAAAHSR